MGCPSSTTRLLPRLIVTASPAVTAPVCAGAVRCFEVGLLPYLLALAAFLTGPLAAAQDSVLAPRVTVTGTSTHDPLSEVLRPSDFAAPAPDAAQLLRTVPGFSLSRVGGGASDPLLRGLGQSRIIVVADGTALEGACSHRMDPPTTYLAADSYDRVSITKGPNSVRFGHAIGGTVEFERNADRPAAARQQLAAGLQAGRFDQQQASVDVQIGNPMALLRAVGNGARSDDYRDGNGTPVHTGYRRYNAGASFSAFAGERLRVDVGAETGDGEAAYPTFHMDGTMFRRNRLSTRIQWRRPDGTLSRLELRAAASDTDHRMDDYSLRPAHVTVTGFSGGSLIQTALLDMDQSVTSRTVAAESVWRIGETAELTVGADHVREVHAGRNRTVTTNCLAFGGPPVCSGAARGWLQYDVEASRVGFFVQADRWAGETLRVRAGFRMDRARWTAGDLLNFQGTAALPGHHEVSEESPKSAFIRFDGSIAGPWTGFVALGRAERTAGALERVSYAGWPLAAERTVQLDTGISYTSERAQAGLDLFVNRIDDFIVTVQGTRSRNVDARTSGGEAWWAAALAPGLRASGSLAWLRGDNITDARPLPQMTPNSLRAGVEYEHAALTLGVSGRIVSRQQRVDIGSGNVTGVDIGPTPGFAVWSLKAVWQLAAGVRWAAGVDNLFDKAYAEHLNRTGAFAPTGFVPTTRVMEPGRVFWVRLDVRLP